MLKIDMGRLKAGLRLSFKEDHQGAYGITEANMHSKTLGLAGRHPSTGELRFSFDPTKARRHSYALTNSRAELEFGNEMRVTISDGECGFDLRDELHSMAEYDVRVDEDGYYCVKVPDSWHKEQSDNLFTLVGI